MSDSSADEDFNFAVQKLKEELNEPKSSTWNQATSAQLCEDTINWRNPASFTQLTSDQIAGLRKNQCGELGATFLRTLKHSTGVLRVFDSELYIFDSAYKYWPLGPFESK